MSLYIIALHTYFHLFFFFRLQFRSSVFCPFLISSSLYTLLSPTFTISFSRFLSLFCLPRFLHYPSMSCYFYTPFSLSTLSYISLCTLILPSPFLSQISLPSRLRPFPPTLPPFRLSLPSSHIYISIKFCESSRNSPPPGCLPMPAVARTESNHTLDKLP